MDTLGNVLLFIGLVSLLIFGSWYLLTFVLPSTPILNPRTPETDAPNPQPRVSREDRLEASKDEEIIDLGGNERTLQVAQVVTLYDMMQRRPSKNSPWVKEGTVSKILHLSDGSWIIKVPASDRNLFIWIRAKLVSTQSHRMAFAPVAKAFKADQSTPLPVSIKGKRWMMVDLNPVTVETKQSSRYFRNTDFLYGITCQNHPEGEMWLIYFDSRAGEAQGPCLLFEGETFDPSTEIKNQY